MSLETIVGQFFLDVSWLILHPPFSRKDTMPEQSKKYVAEVARRLYYLPTKLNTHLALISWNLLKEDERDHYLAIARDFLLAMPKAPIEPPTLAEMFAAYHDMTGAIMPRSAEAIRKLASSDILRKFVDRRNTPEVTPACRARTEYLTKVLTVSFGIAPDPLMTEERIRDLAYRIARTERGE